MSSTANFFFSSRRRHTRYWRDWSSDVCSSDLDEILHAAKLSPLKLTTQLDDEEIARLHRAARDTLVAWIDRIQIEGGSDFPEKVTAFRKGMAAHGRYRQPCPGCGAPAKRIPCAPKRTKNCARCQTWGW